MDIGALTGEIELDDQLSAGMDVVVAKVKQFADQFDGALGGFAVAVGAGIAAVGALTAAITALGSRGADVNDAAGTLEHFAGSAQNANEIMAQLRAGTLDTVDDFTLMKDSARLLSANVQLTAQDFGTLSQAAFVLQNRGLGSTKEMLDLVSDALVTGRTKALAAKVGVVDLGDAEENYATQLGITTARLTDTQKAEAHRIEVMRILNSAVKDAGDQQRDFGEQLEFAETQVMNFFDQLSSGVASSTVLGNALQALFDSFQNTFGGDTQSLVKATVGFLEDAAIGATNLALAAVESARVFHTAWSAIELVVDTVDEGIVGLIATFISATAKVAELAASVPGATSGMKNFAREMREASDVTNAMHDSLHNETQAALDGVTGHSAFDKTLDKLGGTIMNVKDSLVSSKDATVAASSAVADYSANLQAADAVITLTAGQIDALAKTQREYAEAVAAGGSNVLEQRIGAAERAAQAEIEAIRKTKDYTVQAEQQILDTLKVTLENIRSSYFEQDAFSKAHYDRDAELQKATLDNMLANQEQFTAEEIRLQMEKYRDAEQRSEHWRQSAEEDMAAASKSADKTSEAVANIGGAFNDLERLSRHATDAILDQFGDVTTAAEKARHAISGTTEVTAENFQQSLSDFIKTRQAAGNFSIVNPSDGLSLFQQGYTFQQIVDYMFNGKPLPPKAPNSNTQSGTTPLSTSTQTSVTVSTPASVAPYGGGGGGGVVNLAPGSVVFNWPILNDAKAKDEVGRMLGDIFAERVTQQGGL